MEKVGAQEVGAEEVNEVAAAVGEGEKEKGEEAEKDMPRAIVTGIVLPGRWTKEAPGSLPVWEESDGVNGLYYVAAGRVSGLPVVVGAM
jgi:hypothetical protein